MSNDIISKLELACIASCQCLTKTSDFQQHAATCRFRVLNEAIGQIAEQRETIANLTKIVANDLANAEEQRLRIRDAEEDLHNYRTSAETEIAVLRTNVNGLKKHIEVVSVERNNIALERDSAQERERQLRAINEHAAVVKDLLHTAFSGIKGGFSLPDWWVPQVRAAIVKWDELVRHGKHAPLVEHRCGVRGFAESGDVCPACNQTHSQQPTPEREVVKCSYCGTTNTAQISLKLWRCSCGQVFDPKERGNG